MQTNNNDVKISLPQDLYTQILAVDWVRHAESCSNLDSNNIHDKNINPNRQYGYDKMDENDIIDEKYFKKPKKNLASKIKKTTTKVKALAMYHPNISYIGTQQAIELGSHLTDLKSNYDAVFTSATIRSIMTALLACRGLPVTIYVVPFINENINLAGTHDNQNTPLNSVLLKRQIAFIKDWLENNWISNFDDIYVMKILHKLRKRMDSVVDNPYSDNIVILIDDIFKCRVNQKKINNNVDTYGMTCETIPQIKNIMDIIRDKFLIKSDIIGKSFITEDLEKTYEVLSKILSYRFLRGPAVNFSILELYEKQQTIDNNHKYYIHQSLRQPNITEFYNTIIPLAFNLNYINRNNKSISIMCVSHGGIMKKYFSEKYPTKKSPDHVLNTQMFREVIMIDNNNYKPYTFNYNFYIPKLIRTSYKNFEDLNIDICRTQSLKGILNFPLYSDKWTKKIKPKLSFENSPIIDFATSDTKFYFNDTKKYKQEFTSELHGGCDCDK
ncbi:hypothetical protein QLL95_gp0633 [Cotonvirus japonicus]|uniref:Uncharacterized protein n=1 Tax=Cotonvirus japonicus TaxID=2811091 RepID=A0ABM7NTI4_9VIRU|nr:hypothetical protein QLL95_gp0633 [Cotonvirus japonicus]BCS83490.1 hypothetical protein [Cotonvirus japonicus]